MRIRPGCVLALSLMTCSCTRTFTAPVDEKKTQLPPALNGNPCDGDGGVVCQSGVCADGYCCEGNCDADQKCNAPGHEGFCTSRQLGEACDAGAQCPSTFCADGVCCESACADACEICDTKLTPGVCTLVDDNADPRHQCGAACLSCFGGVCGPAVLGTNPVDGCPAGTGCAFDLTCVTTDGGPCTQSTDCATNTCVAGSCLSQTTTQLPFSANPAANEFSLTLESAAATLEGDDAVILHDIEYSDDGSGDLLLISDLLMLFHRHAGGDWAENDLVDYYSLQENGGSYGQVVYLGRRPYVVSWQPPGGAAPGITGREVFDNGILGPVEVIDANASESPSNAYDALAMVARADAAGRVTLSYEDSRGFHAQVRDTVSGSWSSLGDVDRPAGYALGTFGSAVRSGQQVFIYLTQPPNNQDEPYDAAGLTVVALDGTVIATATGADFPCGEQDGFYSGVYLASPRGVFASDEVHFTMLCGGDYQTYLATLDGAGTLSFVPFLGNVGAPPSAVDSVYVEDPQYPRLAFAAQDDNNIGSLEIAFPDGSGASTLVSSDTATINALAAAPTRDALMHVAYITETIDPVTSAFVNPKLAVMVLSR